MHVDYWAWSPNYGYLLSLDQHAGLTLANKRRLARFRLGCHQLPINVGARARLPRVRRVCPLCNAAGTEALGDEPHFLFVCPHLGDLRAAYPSLPFSACSKRALAAQPLCLARFLAKALPRIEPPDLHVH